LKHSGGLRLPPSLSGLRRTYRLIRPAHAADNPPPLPYTAGEEHHMTIFIKIFTTRTLLQIIFVLTATLMMKAVSSHYDFSWATALVAG
jgi:hypothetical protein